MPKILGKAVRVVEHDGLTIDEFVGNVGSNDDSVSIAHVQVSEPASEPWLTLDYEEWICVLKGKIDLHSPSGEVITVSAGETAFIDRGERFRPVFPVADTEYIPVCRPAFSPERCIREEDGVSDVSAKLKELHQTKEPTAGTVLVDVSKYGDVEKIYHMCQKTLWDEAASTGKAYFPPTFKDDGMFTHATAVPQRLVTTANHFYTATEGDWICVELSRSALESLGIQTIFEEAKPVGTIATSDSFETWVCPHIYGGLPAHVEGIVTNIFHMTRLEDGTFVGIAGLSE
ncbi:Protein of unknown function (DUF952) [Fragilaria crotonensis]|nr:Protein of unknown function (DUF952) [Fragilaria crotonensis]